MNDGFGLALVLSAFAFGFRHGIDWDHIAAITDITSSQTSVRTGLRFATLYAAGHAVVVFLIGDRRDRRRRDAARLDRLGHGTGRRRHADRPRHLRDLRADPLPRGLPHAQPLDARLPGRTPRLPLGAPKLATHAHDHVHEHPGRPLTRSTIHPAPATAACWSAPTHTHTHSHTDPFVNYGTGTSLAVGALHGVGAETPTQVLIFLAAAGAGGAVAGVVTLGVFLVGLFAANSMLAVASASGFLAATKRFAVYATVSVITAAASLVLGVSYLSARTAGCPRSSAADQPERRSLFARQRRQRPTSAKCRRSTSKPWSRSIVRSNGRSFVERDLLDGLAHARRRGAGGRRPRGDRSPGRVRDGRGRRCRGPRGCPGCDRRWRC